MDGFRIPLPCNCSGNGLSLSLSTPYTLGAVVFDAVLNYTVWRATPAPPLERAAFLLIDSVITGRLWAEAVLPLISRVNITLPRAEDLLLVEDSVNASAVGIAYNSSLSVHLLDLPLSVFHMTLPRVTFDAGPLGRVSARLTSTFSWNAASDYIVSISSPQREHAVYVTYRLYLDARFGALYPVVLG